MGTIGAQFSAVFGKPMNELIIEFADLMLTAVSGEDAAFCVAFANFRAARQAFPTWPAFAAVFRKRRKR